VEDEVVCKVVEDCREVGCVGYELVVDMVVRWMVDGACGARVCGSCAVLRLTNAEGERRLLPPLCRSHFSSVFYTVASIGHM
jgi:hypothetical protein